jgi:hypothetical protein
MLQDYLSSGLQLVGPPTGPPTGPTALADPVQNQPVQPVQDSAQPRA